MRVTFTLVLLALGAALPGTSFAGCAAPTSATDLEQLLTRAETAFQQLDTAGFGNTLDEAAVALPCLDAPIPTDLAARYHADLGIRMYTLGAADRAREAFSANKAIAPSFTFPATLVPEGHELRQIHASAPASAKSDPLPEPAAGAVYIDGKPQRTRPGDQAAIFQLVVDGKATDTTYLFPGDVLPTYAVSAVADGPSPASRKKGSMVPRLGVAAVGVGLAAGAGVVYSDAAKSAAHFEDADNGLERAELIALSEDVNQQVMLSAGLGIGSAAALGVAFAWPW